MYSGVYGRGFCSLPIGGVHGIIFFLLIGCRCLFFSSWTPSILLYTSVVLGGVQNIIFYSYLGLGPPPPIYEFDCTVEGTWSCV